MTVPVWECPVKRELRLVREERQAAQDAGGCSAMTSSGKRCGELITHRTSNHDMPLCRVHASALTKTGLTCEVWEGRWVGLHKKTKAVRQ